MTEAEILAIIRLVINGYVAVRAVVIAYQIFRYDSRLIARAAAWFLLGMSGYNALAAAVFSYTQITGERTIFDLGVGWYYVAANSLEALPFLILDFILRHKWQSDTYDNHMAGLEMSLDTLRGMRGHFTFDQLPEDAKVKIESLEDSIGNLATDIRGTKQLYTMKGELGIGTPLPLTWWERFKARFFNV